MGEDREQWRTDPVWLTTVWHRRAIDALDALDTAESQRDTLRTALIEAQSWIGDWHFTPTAPILARIREALEGTA